MTSSNPNYLPMAPSPTTITLGLGLQHRNIQPIAPPTDIMIYFSPSWHIDHLVHSPEMLLALYSPVMNYLLSSWPVSLLSGCSVWTLCLDRSQKQLAENKSRTKTKPESHPPCPGWAGGPAHSASGSFSTWWGRRRRAPSRHRLSQVPNAKAGRQARRGRRGSRSPGPRGWPTWG